jgi:hypothetical protein
MSSQPDQGDAIRHRISISRPDRDAVARAHHPLTVSNVQVDGNLKTIGPFDHRRIIMWMGDGDGGKAAQVLNPCRRLVIDQTHAVPEHIALWGLQ